LQFAALLTLRLLSSISGRLAKRNPSAAVFLELLWVLQLQLVGQHLAHSAA
jgi:hypothetical protein